MAEVATHKTTDQHKADPKRPAKSASEDTTPVPTQDELNRFMGEKDQKVEPQKAPEKVPPFPTQDESDKYKAEAFGTTVEQQKELSEAEKKSRESRDAATKDVVPPPTPTQDELDDHKKAIMYEAEDNPGGGPDPQEPPDQVNPHKKQLEAKPAGGGYQTRTVESHSAKTGSKSE
jgi:hypothetical protein